MLLTQGIPAQERSLSHALAPKSNLDEKTIAALWYKRLGKDISWQKLSRSLERLLGKDGRKVVWLKDGTRAWTSKNYDIAFVPTGGKTWEIRVFLKPSERIFFKTFLSLQRKLGKRNSMLFWRFPQEALTVWKSLLASLAKHSGGNDIESFVQSLPKNINRQWVYARLRDAMRQLLLADVNLDRAIDIVYFDGDPLSLDKNEKKIIMKEIVKMIKGDAPPTPHSAEYAIERRYSELHQVDHTTFLFRAGKKWVKPFERYLQSLITRRIQEGDLSLTFLSFPASTGAEAYSIAAVIENALIQYYQRMKLPPQGLDDWMAKWNVRVRAPDIALGPLFKTGRGIYDMERHFAKMRSRDEKEMRLFAKYMRQGLPPIPGEHCLVRASVRLRSYVQPEYGDVNSPVDRKTIYAGPLDGVFFNNLSPYVSTPTLRAIESELSDAVAQSDQTFLVPEFKPQIIYSRESLKDRALVADNPRLQWLQEALAINAPDYPERIRRYLSASKSSGILRGKRRLAEIEAAERLLQETRTWDFGFVRRQIADELSQAAKTALTFQDKHALRILLDLDLPAPPEMDSLENADITRMDGPTLVYWYGRLAVLQQQKTGGSKIKILEALSKRILDAVEAGTIPRRVFEMYFFHASPRFSKIVVLIPYYPSLFYTVADSFDPYTVHGTGWRLSDDVVAAKKRPGKLLLVAISAPPGGGQTTRAAELEKELRQKGHRVRSFSTDDYLKTKHERNAQNLIWGQEDTYYWNQLRYHMKDLKNGLSFTPPSLTTRLTLGAIDPEKLDVLIVEGQYALLRDELRDMLDIRICIDEFDALRFRQLVDRDINQRGYTEEDAIWKFVVSQGLEFGAATRNMMDFANVIVRPLERKLWTKKGFFPAQKTGQHIARRAGTIARPSRLSLEAYRKTREAFSGAL